MPDPWSRKARVIGSRLDCLNLRLQGWNRTSIATACMGDADGIERYELRRLNFPPIGRRPTRLFKGLNEGPTSRSDVRFDRTRDRLQAARPRATEWP
jgi:hypothetical protein